MGPTFTTKLPSSHLIMPLYIGKDHVRRRIKVRRDLNHCSRLISNPSHELRLIGDWSDASYLSASHPNVHPRVGIPSYPSHNNSTSHRNLTLYMYTTSFIVEATSDIPSKMQSELLTLQISPNNNTRRPHNLHYEPCLDYVLMVCSFLIYYSI